MDELDRMFGRLVHNIRAGFPDLLSRPFEVSAIHQHLVPYRLNRAELGIDSAEEYEVTLMHLLSGSRGLLAGDPDMQAALRAELESPNPDLSIFRAWGTATVSIPATAIRALDSQSPPAVHVAQPVVSTRQAEMAGRATLEVSASSASPGPSRAAPTMPSPVIAAAVASRPAAPPAPKPAAAPSKPAASAPSARPALSTPDSAARTHGMGCRYCGGELPEGRDALFCPHCGQNLSVKQCPACSTELEVEWQFCITCGRQVE
jgi:hypothetical protein